MSAKIQLRSDYDAVQLRRIAQGSKDARQVRRLLSLAAVYDGMSRAGAAKLGSMDRQTLRDWAHRFNDMGPAGLTNKGGAGPKSRLTETQLKELAGIVEAGPDLVKDGIVRWRRVDLQAVIKARFGVEYHERYVGCLLNRMGFSHMSCRPQHPKQDPQAIDVFKKLRDIGERGYSETGQRHAH